MTDILSSQFQAIGVSLDVQPMEFPRWLQTVFSNAQDYDLTIINHVEERDIGNYANPKYYWHYSNNDIADALGRADAEPDLTKRNALYKQIQQQLADASASCARGSRGTRSRASRRRSISETPTSRDADRPPAARVAPG
jgi:peptide/nickel transport system substrate-binding protein